jgi:hypothetical protein
MPRTELVAYKWALSREVDRLDPAELEATERPLSQWDDG